MSRLALRVRAWLALATFLGTFALPFAASRHLTFDDDAACGASEFSRPGHAAQVDESRATLPAGHCALCHWLRAVGGARADVGFTTVAWLDPIRVVFATVVNRPAINFVPHGPSRAPPAAIL